LHAWRCSACRGPRATTYDLIPQSPAYLLGIYGLPLTLTGSITTDGKTGVLGRGLASGTISVRLAHRNSLGIIMRIIAFLMFTALSIMPLHAAAPEYGTKEEAVAMVKRVQEMFKQDGADATFKAVSDPSAKEFHDRDLYPFIYFRDGDKKGLCVAHGARPALIGKNLIGLKDQDGKYLVQALADVANGPGSGWVDYKWPNPTNNKIEDKSSYVEKMGDYFVGVGVYR
jgi:cytochrome c